MRKLSILVSLLALVVLGSTLKAQTRARRVGQNPEPSTSTASNPSRPPVLGGPNKTGNDQSPRQPAPNAGPEEVGENDVIRVNTTLVTIPVSVMDRNGRYAPDLRKEDFRLWEDGIEQNIAFFASVDKPFSVVLMLDTSGSTRFKLEEIQDAAIAFVNQLHADDRVMVVSFDDRVRVLSEFTSDRYRLHDAIRHTRPGDGTKLYDAVDMVINEKLESIAGRKAIVLFTDGVDTTSKRASYESTVRDAEELDALIYPVEYNTYSDPGGGSTSWPGSRQGRHSTVGILIDILGGIGGSGGGRGGSGGGGGNGSRHDYERADRYLHELADRTGARLYNADSSQNLTNAFANVAEELRRQYSLGYYPKRPAQAGQRRQIRVRVNQPNLAVRTRDSYIFNPQANAPGQTDAGQKPAPVLQKKLAQTAGSTW
jgi:Ca-activated chloride channel family protein